MFNAKKLAAQYRTKILKPVTKGIAGKYITKTKKQLKA